ncbi:MAG TPA: ABC transporter ATP-binding protein [Planctomycetota bacterium]|nr:ABC transporter ATP-binding protein [Planctomycetota bacterium]
MSLVEVSNLSRSFGDLHAVRDVSFAFDAGEIYGFIGPNGAGKSTTMRILATLDIPSRGDCTVGGLSTVDDADKVRSLIGYMPDSYGSYPNMTVVEYLDFFARSYGLKHEARARAVGDVVEFCQLGNLRGKAITTLSKGMKQRLCLGRCLIHDPKLLILDEPSAGLDPRARIEFRELLLVLAKQGKAIFISSHILADLEELCHGVAIIERGELVASGRVDDIKARAQAAMRASDQGRRAAVLELRLAAAHPSLATILAEQPELSDVRIENTRATARVRGDEAAVAALVKRLVDAGVPLCHIASRDDNLEDLFMHLTEGKVQ